MEERQGPCWWVRIHLRARPEIWDLQNVAGVELFTATLRTIDERHFLIDGHVRGEVLESLSSKYPVRVLGDVTEGMKKNREYVSRTNRYLKK
jgi:hypothetical protein